MKQKAGFYFSFLLTCCFLCLLTSCSINRQISKQATQILLKDSSIRQGHIGISIYEPATGKYWFEHNADKYFIPASNTKLFTLYAGMKYLGDSLVGLRYDVDSDNNVNFQPTGDPTFLHPDFANQPVLNFLKKASSRPLGLVTDFNFYAKALGRGWAWDDYSESYMTERSALPINGNLVTFKLAADSFRVFPELFYDKNYSGTQGWNKAVTSDRGKANIKRNFAGNYFSVSTGRQKLSEETFVPFVTGDQKLIKSIMEEVLQTKLGDIDFTHGPYRFREKVFSQPADSMYKLMMHRSDNFFAEQTLLMASNEFLGYMSDTRIIDTLLATHLKDLPQQPKWVDGSGLSRYNLFTPKSFVRILDKMRTEFGWQRMTNILPTGGEGTISNFYKSEAGFIYAKTGTLSNNCALSGYLITRKNKLLIFSVLANNYPTSATPVRRAVEKFLKNIRQQY